MTFFESLAKPSWIPPDAAFPMVWFGLWTLQALAVAAMLTSARPTRVGLAAFVGQLVLSVAWQAVLFGPGRLAVSAWALVIVLVMLVVTVWKFWGSSRLAGALMVPTVVWVGFATALAFELHRLNPDS